MSDEPLCPYCETPLFAGDIPTAHVEEVALGDTDAVMVWCGNCQKLLGILPDVQSKRTSKR